MNETPLQVSHLYKSFPLSRKQRIERKTNESHLVAVDDVSFSLKRGEIYGLLGPNGAGKTTTLRMVASLLKCEKGEIRYGGKDIKEDVSAYRSKVGFLTSELKLDEFFTPSYTFEYMSNLYGVPHEVMEKRRELLFERFGVTPFKDSQIKNLSTGMKQKASLAISICHDPEIMIYDEPTNGLDIIASRDVENFLLDLRGQGKAIVISTHIFSLVEKLCDRVGIIIDGKMRLEDTLANITKDKSLEDAFFDLIEEDKQ
ncbi:MAG: ABC transporter ATP-binding protein [Bacilli bacterium]|nr:ABC transporter ATP-binding protein [Bacilli bacterium]